MRPAEMLAPEAVTAGAAEAVTVGAVGAVLAGFRPLRASSPAARYGIQ